MILEYKPQSSEQMRSAGQSRVKQWYSLQVHASRSYQVVREAQQ